MRPFAGRYTYFLLLALVFIIAEVVVNPLGDFPLNDDWAYGKAVLLTANDHYTTGGFGAMTLFTHLMWGLLFTKLFGFSFTVLRFSSLISALLGSFFLYKVILKMTHRPLAGFFLCLVLLFNPLLFNLANTFMTDVTFNTLLIFCCYFAFTFFDEKKIWPLILFFICSLALVLVRQYGIIAPLCFVVACLFLREKKKRYLLYACLGLLVVTAVFKLYENYLAHILSPGAVYKFSDNIHPFEESFWNGLFENLGERYRLILLHILLYTSPGALLFIIPLSRGIRPVYVWGLAFLCLAATYLLFDQVQFPDQNIFSNLCLGPETFHEFKGHAYSEAFGKACEVSKYLLSALTLLFLTLFFISPGRKSRLGQPGPIPVFLTGLLLAYTVMILVTESYFDRYHIPLITTGLVLFAWMCRSVELSWRPTAILLLVFFYVSVFGTRDYLTLNRLRWKAFYDTEKQAGVTAEKINGGFEVNCWNDGKGNWWYDYQDLKPFDYLIQFKKEEDFRLLRAYPFQRYLPYKKDTLNLYIREKK